MAQVKTAETNRGESGFALVLAILSLLLLTFLGLTMATTTSTELQIATNYRWSQQALYNAEAGIELGKRFLRQIEWQVVLPQPRTAPLSSWPGYSSANCTQGHCPTPTLTRAARSFENEACDVTASVGPSAGYQGFGFVLDDVNFAVPFENVSTFLGQSLSGNFTLWVRRPYVIPPEPAPPELQDDARNDRLILTAEGIAPQWNLGGTAFGQANRARRILEVTLQRIAPGDCENRTSQAGSGPLGAGFDQCDPIRQEGILGGVTAISGVQ